MIALASSQGKNRAQVSHHNKRFGFKTFKEFDTALQRWNRLTPSHDFYKVLFP